MVHSLSFAAWERRDTWSPLECQNAVHDNPVDNRFVCQYGQIFASELWLTLQLPSFLHRAIEASTIWDTALTLTCSSMCSKDTLEFW